MGSKDWSKKKNQQEEFYPDNNSTNIEDTMKTLGINEQIKDDIISCLPDDILSRIISFLPFDSAIRTSLLSTRWENLWKKAFLARDGTIEDVVHVVTSFLNVFHQLRKSDKNWEFQFSYGEGHIVSVAVDPNNNTLHLDFSSGKPEFPTEFGIAFSLDHKIRTHEPFPYTFKAKSLHLTSLGKLSCVAASDIALNCPFLASVTITKCNGLEIVDFALHCSSLRSLSVLDCPQLKKLFIGGDSFLWSFRFRGLLPCFNRFVFNLVIAHDAMLDFRQGPGDIDIKTFDFTIFRSIEYVKSLTICRWFFETVICRKLQISGENLLFGSLTDLWWIEYSEARYNSDALISFLKFCPRLERLYVTIDPSSYGVSGRYWYPEKVPWTLSRKNLKVVKLEGLANEEEEILVAMKLKELFSVEPLIIAKSSRTCLRRLVKVPNKKMKKKKEGKLPYKFKQGVENLHEVCPNHVHMDL
ncbi:F-box protein At2g39490-like [Durio zibethinus]|uniref:F-box protein At2g39490-like n=1 Tax=Durio zibethinus TaxID=66656 RepID=A0A6P6AHK7_DURZI|nr:F-box protein At2g39490-like [Durio zibethinus]